MEGVKVCGNLGSASFVYTKNWNTIVFLVVKIPKIQ
jgi:hypothetical protein